MEDEVVRGMTIKIDGDASDLKSELREVRNLAKKASAAVASCTGKAKRMQETLRREAPEREDVAMALARFVIRVAEDEKATPDQLKAMSEVARLLV